ncbi:DUF2213 domain-containing protein [Candidatus Pacearchaeota archaeon]|nr:DUF2213 domain-containing protein [Candidatus Pacearchaeota archaeon]
MQIKQLFKIRDLKNFKVQISDDVILPTVSTRELTPEGYLKATAAVTKVGVQMYSARDFGADSDEPVGVLRPAETVFHPETAESLKLKPIVLLHPEYDIDSTNHSRLSIGTVGETVEKIGTDILGAAIQITDDAVVKQILGREIEELSLGYDVFIISEEGIFNGQKYLYRMDGPMLNNHLAIVPEGRCGDSVKILDKGVDTVNKKQMIKALRDAGVSEDKIKLFMADMKDDDAGDFGAYTKLLLDSKIKDIDMTALIPALVAELKPQLEEAVKTPEFLSNLAKEIAAGMSGAQSTEGTEVDEGDEEGETEEITPEVMDAKIKDGIKSRAIILDRVRDFITDKDFKIHDATDRELLEKALKAAGVKDEQMKDQSDDYLSGLLDMVVKDRDDAGKFINKNWSKDSGTALSKPMNALDARKQLKD